jgi:putative zinc finger protein
MKLRLKCNEATALLLAREDRPLPLWEQLALRAHLAACRACPVVARQLEIMRRGLRQWREDATSGPE